MEKMSELVMYAYERGVTVIPEIDMPAHTRSWGTAFPHFVVSCPRTCHAAENPTDIVALDPSRLITDKAMEDIGTLDESSGQASMLLAIRAMLGQLAETFNTTSYLHIGGDEVSMKCWSEDVQLKQWADKNQMTNIQMLERFQKIVINEVYMLERIPIMWQESLDSGAVPDSFNVSFSSNSAKSRSTRPVIQPWKCWGGLATRSAASALAGDRMSYGYGYKKTNPEEGGSKLTANRRKRITEYLHSSGYPTIMAACDYLDFDSDLYHLLTNEDLIAVSVKDAVTKLERMSVSFPKGESSRVLSHFEDVDDIDNSNDDVGVHHDPDTEVAVECTSVDCENDANGYDTEMVNDERSLVGVDESSDELKRFIQHKLVNVYDDSADLNQDEMNDGLMLGGEACLWTEKVDYANYECRLWPRVTSVGARLWGNNQMTSLSPQQSALCSSGFHADSVPVDSIRLLENVVLRYVASRNHPSYSTISPQSFEEFFYTNTSLCHNLHIPGNDTGWKDASSWIYRKSKDEFGLSSLSRRLMLAYVNFGEHLRNHFGIKTADIVLHIGNSRVKGGSNSDAAPKALNEELSWKIENYKNIPALLRFVFMHMYFN